MRGPVSPASVFVRVLVLIVASVSTTASLQAQTFVPTSGTNNWNSGANWSTNPTFPNASGASATFTATAAMTVPLNVGITVGSITALNDSAGVFNIQAGTAGTLTFANGGSEATMILNGTSTTTNNFTISTNVVLTDTLRTTVNNVLAITALTSSPMTFTGAMSGAGGFIKDGPGRLSFTTATKTYTGATVVNQGRLRVSVAGMPTGTSSVLVNAGGQLALDAASGAFQFGSASTVITINGAGETQTSLPGALRNENSGTTTLANPVTLGSDATIHTEGTGRILQLNGAVSGAFTLTKTGTGTIQMTQANASLSGGTIVREGVVTVNAGSQLGTGLLTLAPFTNRSTTVALSNANQSIGNLATDYTSLTTGTQVQTLTLAGTALAITQTANTSFGNGGIATLTGVIGGTGSIALTAASTGTLTLTGPNTYSGGSTVQAGTLSANGSTATFGTGNVTVNGAAGASSLQIQSGVLNAIADTATLTLAGGGTAGTADIGFANLGSGVSETVATLVLNGIMQSAGTYGSTASGATFQNDEFFNGTGVIVVVPVPEPASILFATFGIIGVARLLRRKSS